MVLGMIGSLGGFASSLFSDKELDGRYAMASAFDAVAGKTSPPIREALTALGDKYLKDREQYIGSSLKARYIERMLFSDQSPFGSAETFPILREWVWHEDKDPENVYRIDPLFAAVIRMTPVIGTELNFWLEPLSKDPIDRRGLVGGLGYLMRQYSGIGKEYAHTPATQMYYLDESRAKSFLKRQTAEAKKRRGPSKPAEDRGPSKPAEEVEETETRSGLSREELDRMLDSL